MSHHFPASTCKASKKPAAAASRKKRGNVAEEEQLAEIKEAFDLFDTEGTGA